MDNLVTIAIASYNNATYIERCIDSVISQTYPTLEILIVDDGSKDDTLLRIERYREDQRVRILAKENGGLSSVRQMGLDNAQGDYICFIDADDYLMNTYVEQMLHKLEVEKSDVCICSTRFEDAEGNYLKAASESMKCSESILPFSVSMKQYSNLSDTSEKRVHLSDSWNKMYRTRFVRDCRVRFSMPKGLNGSDSLFNRLLFLHEPYYSSVQSVEYVHVIYKRSAVHRRHKDLQSSFMYIVKQMNKQTKKLSCEHLLKERITYYYYIGAYRAFRDVWLENDKQRKVIIKKMILRHKEFRMEEGIGCLRRESFIPYPFLYLFSFCINYCPSLLGCFLKIQTAIKY